MRSQVAVTWSDSRTYRIDLEEVQPMPHEQARVWLDQQFTELDCEPIRQSGKVLTADKVLLVAQAAGQALFLRGGTPRMGRFLCPSRQCSVGQAGGHGGSDHLVHRLLSPTEARHPGR